MVTIILIKIIKYNFFVVIFETNKLVCNTFPYTITIACESIKPALAELYHKSLNIYKSIMLFLYILSREIGNNYSR